jgi:peptide/nickel transport system permease protein
VVRLLPGSIVLFLVLLAVLVPSLFTHLDPLKMSSDVLSGPMSGHPLGTDGFGRDIFARIVYGARPDMEITLGAVFIAGVLGTPIGMLGSYFGGVAASLTTSAINVLISFPPIVLAMFVVAFLGPGVVHLMLIIGFLYAPMFARLSFTEVVAVRNVEFVDAARAVGCSRMRILALHILPNIIGPIIVLASLSASTALLLASGLSFLGLGVVPPTPSWGEMIANSQQFLFQDPKFLLWPSLALSLTVLAINSIGDVLRDYLDPHARTRASGA